MVDELEMEIIDAEGERDIPVVIRWIDIFNKWYICHAKSYQNAFRKDVNGFDTRGEAVIFAENHDCNVVFYDTDPLQQEPSISCQHRDFGGTDDDCELCV